MAFKYRWIKYWCIILYENLKFFINFIYSILLLMSVHFSFIYNANIFKFNRNRQLCISVIFRSNLCVYYRYLTFLDNLHMSRVLYICVVPYSPWVGITWRHKPLLRGRDPLRPQKFIRETFHIISHRCFRHGMSSRRVLAI